MRALVVTALAFLAAGCVVPLAGAPCDTDDNCPRGQSCSASTRTCEPGSGQPTPDAGASCVSDPVCSGTAAATVCDASGRLATCEESSPGCRKVKSAVACATGKSCQSGACRCSSGCAKDETACSADGKLKTCQVAAGAECGTFGETACDTGLVCSSANGPARCVCPAPVPDGTLYVDPSSSNAELEPSGALQPASCRFARLTDALAKASSGDIVTLGADAAATSASVLDQETFPLAVPAGVRVAAAGCPGASCDPARWTLVVPATATGASAMTLAADSTVAGLTLKYAGAPVAAFVSCDAGSVVLEDVALVGSDDATAKATKGFFAADTCKPALSRVTASLFTEAGVSVDGAEAQLTFVGGGVQSSGTGLEVLHGTATLAPGNDLDDATRPRFVDNALGIQVGDDGFTAELEASKPFISGTGTGLALDGAAKATLSGATITLTTDSPARGIEARGGELTLAGGTINLGDTGLYVSGANVLAGDTAIQGQSGNGVEVLSTPRDVIFNRVRITGTKAAGVKHQSGTLAIFDSEIDGHIDDGVKVLGGTIELANTKVHDNGVYGVSVSGAEASVRECDVYANGNKNAGGGLGFVGADASLGLFYSNTLHGNFRAQMYVGAAPAAGTSWKISSTTCSSTINKLYCYATDAYGLLVENTTVAANNVSWMHSPPTAADKDFQGNVTLSPATAYCSVTACP